VVVRRFTVGAWLFVWQENTLRPAGLGVLLGLPTLSIVASLAYVRIVRAGRPWCRPIAEAYGVVVLTALWDVAIGIAEAPLPYLSEHVLLAFVSVTAYALLERLLDELSARTAELRSLDGVLKSVRQTLAEREHLALVGELSAIVAHEVRNPLAVIRNATSSLQKPDRPANERLLLFSIIEEECDRLNRLVTDLLTLARPISPQLRMVDVPELLDRSLEPARRADTEVDVRFDLSGAEPLYCDAQLLRHALENLVENAVQAMGARGALTVTVTRRANTEGTDREFAVIDSGEGMNTDVRNNARRPFFTTRTSGTGLGLAIVERIVTAHHGALDIESKRGRGTTVRIRIPEQRPSAPDVSALM
jgi:signal transduction histidine kinase